MPDEVAGKHNDVLALLGELLERLQDADQKLETDPRAAVKDALQVMQGFIIEASRAIAPDGVPRIVPGRAIGRFVQALDTRDQGILDPVVAADAPPLHTLSLTTKLTRAQVGMAMEMLMRADRSFAAAKKEVARLLGANHKIFHGLTGNRERIVERFRAETVNSDDPDIKKFYNECLGEATRILRDHEGGAAELVRSAHRILSELRYA
jgi:hypothetical protein